MIYYSTMFKFGLIIAAWLGAILPGLAAVAVAEASTLLTVSSTGPDCYADGSPVVDGEYYALVSIDSGANFAGFAADGTVVDPAKLSGAPQKTGLLPNAKTPSLARSS